MSKSNLCEVDWLISLGKNMKMNTGDVIKYSCIKPYVPSVPEKEHKETQQTQIRRVLRRLVRNYTVCLQESIFEIE